MKIQDYQQHSTLRKKTFLWKETCQIIYDTLFKIIGKPDLTIFIYADKNTRIERITKRNSNDEDLKDSLFEDSVFEKMVDFAEKNVMRYVILDTTNLSIDKSKREIEKIINKEIGNKTMRRVLKNDWFK